MSRDISNSARLLIALSNVTLNVSRDGASTTPLGNLCQGFTTLTVKNFFLMSSPNTPSDVYYAQRKAEIPTGTKFSADVKKHISL